MEVQEVWNVRTSGQMTHVPCLVWEWMNRFYGCGSSRRWLSIVVEQNEWILFQVARLKFYLCLRTFSTESAYNPGVVRDGIIHNNFQNLKINTAFFLKPAPSQAHKRAKDLGLQYSYHGGPSRFRLWNFLYGSFDSSLRQKSRSIPFQHTPFSSSSCYLYCLYYCLYCFLFSTHSSATITTTTSSNFTENSLEWIQ